jgi:NhaP-type Na+/H+ or K+/H+ antiporter
MAAGTLPAMTANPASTLALAIGVGVVVSLLCARARIPAILPLMVTGVLLGPHGLGLADGDLLGAALGPIISVAVGLLIFEGSMHLDREALLRAP